MMVLVCGGRDFSDRELLNRELSRLHKEHNFTTVVQGGARGADRLASEWAAINKIPCRTYQAEWRKYGKGAGMIRNQSMIVAGPKLVIAFPGHEGTEDMVSRAKDNNIPVIEIKETEAQQ